MVLEEEKSSQWRGPAIALAASVGQPDVLPPLMQCRAGKKCELCPARPGLPRDWCLAYRKDRRGDMFTTRVGRREVESAGFPP
jgi:hypothetical protein